MLEVQYRAQAKPKLRLCRERHCLHHHPASLFVREAWRLATQRFRGHHDSTITDTNIKDTRDTPSILPIFRPTARIRIRLGTPTRAAPSCPALPLDVLGRRRHFPTPTPCCRCSTSSTRAHRRRSRTRCTVFMIQQNSQRNSAAPHARLDSACSQV
jgi:hypothetical protein